MFTRMTPNNSTINIERVVITYFAFKKFFMEGVNIIKVVGIFYSDYNIYILSIRSKIALNVLERNSAFCWQMGRMLSVEFFSGKLNGNGKCKILTEFSFKGLWDSIAKGNQQEIM